MENKQLKTLEEKMDQLGAQLSALDYALYLVEKKHQEAADMVAHVPNNIYIEDWKREERYTAQKMEQLKQLKETIGAEQSKICAKIDKLYL